MAQVNVHEAKTKLSKLLVRAQAGERIIIAKNGKPVAELRPIRAPRGGRTLGSARAEVVFHGDFNAPLPPEVLAEFER